ncbi:MAG: pilus assembly protein [Chloroflexi bacterium]|nr:pilus assembly protein [Chloroflexota bacterium]
MSTKRATSRSNRADRVGDGSRGRVGQRLFAAAPSERGQALIEFALLLPILLVFMLTVLDFGLALDNREVIQHAVREGARQAAVGLDEADVIDVVVSQSQGVLEADDVTICYVDGPTGAPAGFAGSDVRVSATFLYRFTLGSGELLAAIGIDPDSLAIEMTPSGEARLETSNAGATVC